jgi:hypothetical protein
MMVVYLRHAFSFFRNCLEPCEGKIIDTSMHTPGETKGDSFRDSLGKFDVLADDVEEGVEGIAM